ncbi:hypothetical protein PTI98_010279 [Pleurotus ostreatus]|nr:hypothetical protein PTI98_010279 [Pleurotus ostreatus]
MPIAQFCAKGAPTPRTYEKYHNRLVVPATSPSQRASDTCRPDTIQARIHHLLKTLTISKLRTSEGTRISFIPSPINTNRGLQESLNDMILLRLPFHGKQPYPLRRENLVAGETPNRDGNEPQHRRSGGPPHPCALMQPTNKHSFTPATFPPNGYSTSTLASKSFSKGKLVGSNFLAPSDQVDKKRRLSTSGYHQAATTVHGLSAEVSVMNGLMVQPKMSYS